MALQRLAVLRSVITENLQSLNPDQLRQTVQALMTELVARGSIIERNHRESASKQATIDKLMREMAVLKRLKFSAAIVRSNWLFAGSLRAGQRVAAVMSLRQSARLNGLEPWAYLKPIMERLPTQPVGRIDELLPWNAAAFTGTRP